MSHSRNVMVKQESRPSFVCYVCGSISGDYIPLHSKPRESGPYFSFLEHHQPPNGSARPGPDGVVGSCFICYSFLSQQWESFERNETSHSKRLYWLKRTDNVPFAGMDAGNQSEYATSYLGFVPPTNHVSQLDKRDSMSPADSVSQSTLGSQYNKQDYPEPLDCTIEDNSRLSQKPNNEGGESSSVLDLSVQTRISNAAPIQSVSPNSSSLVCYTCGEDVFRGALFNIFTKPVANYPYFPNLWSQPKSSRARPMDSMGKIEVCELCHRQLIRQWEAYQRANVPNNERQYQIQGNYNQVSKESFTSINTPNAHNQFFCFTCGQEYPKSVRRELKTRPSSDGEPYFRFLEKHHPAPGARPITNDWKVMVCTLCYKALFRQFRVYQIEKTPEELRTYKIPAEFLQESNVLRDRLLGHSKNERQVIDVSTPSSCYLCDRPSNNVKMVNTLPNQASKMYFPFVREIAKPPTSEPMDSLGRVAICLTCYLLLQTQWEAFQNAQVPINQRHYSLSHSSNHLRGSQISTSPSSAQESAKNHNSTLHIQVTTPEEQSSVNHHNVVHEPLLTTVTTMSYSSVITTPSRHIPIHPPPALLPYKEHSELLNRSSKSSKESAIDENQDNSNNPRIYNPLELPKTKQPLMVATTCYICGECSSPGSTYSISVFPSRSGSSEDFQTPFFPFLSKHIKPTAADAITEDGTILGCTFCYHSLMAQWLAYETSPHAEDANHWTRKYNTHHYVCYICGITTYRKRVRAITVRDFPFLVEHPRPPGALTTQNGESVVTCLTCFESLMSQWKDFERMKLPVEMRKYNWIPIPPPPDDINLIDPATRQQNLSRDSTPVPAGTSRTPTPSLGPSLGHASTQDQSANSNRHDNQTSLGHGVAKPAPTMLNMQQHPQHPNCNTNNKPVSVRGMATAVSPLYQVGQPPSHAPPPPPSSHGGNHNLGVFGGNPAAAYNAARTSSFAAALRKLAKQAVDPATEKDLSPITPVSSPAYSQRSTTPKRSVPQSVYMNNVHSHGHQSRLPSPPPSSNSSLVNHDSQKQPLDLGSVSSRDSNGNRLGDSLPLKLDNKYDKRDDHYSIKDLSSSVLNSRNQLSSRLEDHQVPPPILPTTTSSSGRGFQPYRGLEDGNRHSLGSHSQGPSHHHPNASPSSHHLGPHFEHSAGYAAYHSAFLPSPHLAHPAYRFEDPVFLEHYSSMLRPPSLIHPLSQAGLLPHGPPPPPVPQPSTGPPPSVPFFPSTTPNSHYPRDLMISQAQNSVNFVSPSSATAATIHENRLKYDERMTNREPYSSEQDSYERRDHSSSGISRRLSDPVNEGVNEQRSSPMQPLHLSRHIESPGGDHRIGSITHGTPREHHHSSSLGPSHPPQTRSPESPSGGTSTPLNLATHHNSTNNVSQDLHRSRHHDVELWVARHVSNASNNISTSQNHHLQDRHERYSPVTPSQPPPLLSAPPPSTLSSSQQPLPLEQHQVPIRSEYQHSLPANYHLQANSQRDSQEMNRQYQIHQQQYIRQQQLTHRKQSSSGPMYNSSSDANRTNQYDRSKSKFNSPKTPENSHVPNNISSQNHGYNNGASHRTDDMFIKTVERDRENIADSRSTEKAVTLDRWTYYRQEGMQSRLMELEKPAMESKEPPSVPAHHYNYSQHQSNEHSRGFQIVSRTNHVESNCVEVLVSKLDLEEARLKKARMDENYLSESESSDIEENVNKKEVTECKLVAKKDVLNQKELWQDWGPQSLSRPFILSKGPSIALDTNPTKMEILRSVGLMTVKRCKELELEKFFRRQKHLKEALPLKVVENEDQENQIPFPISIIVSSLSTKQAVVCNVVTKKLNSENGKSKWQQKNFLGSLDLKVNQDGDHEEHEIIWRAIIQDRCRRHKIPLPLMENQESNCTLDTYESASNEAETRGVKRKLNQTLLPHHNGLVSSKSNAMSLLQSGALNPSTDTSASKENDKSSSLPLANHVPEYHNSKFLNPRSGAPPLQPITSCSGHDQIGPPSIPPPLIPAGRSSKPMTIATLDSEKRVVLLTNSTSKSGSISSTLAPNALSKDKLTNSGLKPPPLSISSARQMPREFAQEFHQLVLQTTKQQLENNISRESASLPVPPLLHNPNSSLSSQNHPSHSKTQLNVGTSYSGMPKLANSLLSSTSSHHATSIASVSSFSENYNPVKHESSSVQETFYDRDSDGCLKWPGIEAIMESFEKHRREQNLEREFLSERCQYNQSHTQELDRAAEIYSQRMAELYQLKCHLDEERQRHQSAIDNLKKCLRQIR